ncbi:c-type cytochrome [Arcobacteraceae bacterium]|nr:c-type cytochrome [Arcobacteraceae bacterium]
MNKITLLVLLSFSILLANDIDEKKFKYGKYLYNETCISCHGIDGKAKTNMKLIVKPRDLSKTLLTEEQTYNITKDGAHYWGAKADIMPAFKSVFNEKQLRAVTYYIVNKFNSDLEKRIKKACSTCEKEPINQDAAMKKWGKKIFKRNCIYCHGEKGKGDGIATKNPEDSIFPYDLTKTLLTRKQIFLYVKFGGKHWGTNKNDMPSWSRKYNDFKLRSVARYIDEVIRKKEQ